MSQDRKCPRVDERRGRRERTREMQRARRGDYILGRE
jgi:hypothetical protein